MENLKQFIYQACTRLKWQLLFTVLVLFTFLLNVYSGNIPSTSILEIKKPDYISYISGLASIAALFCSVSFGFILYFIQATKSERYSTYNEFKSKVREFGDFADSLPDGKERNIFKSLIWELDKHDLSDLPQVGGYGEHYDNYANALEEALNSKKVTSATEAFFNSAMHMGYIEQLLNRLGVNAIKIICTKNFVDTLTKGIVLVVIMIMLMFVSNIYFGNHNIIGYISAVLCISIMLSFVFIEFLMDIYRQMNEDLDFVHQRKGAQGGTEEATAGRDGS